MIDVQPLPEGGTTDFYFGTAILVKKAAATEQGIGAESGFIINLGLFIDFLE